ncbi:MAG: sensor histidine kinase [Streptosporangiaceae bacterium]|nr:sensor histidine kinase [Streptosporangiaceae bacterium]
MATPDKARPPSLIIAGVPPRYRSTWWRMFFSGIWLVYLIEPVVYLFRHHYGTLYIAGALAILAAFCVIYVLVLARWHAPARYSYAGLAALAALAVIASAAYGGGAVALWIYVSAAAGLLIPQPRLAVRAVLGAVAAYVLFSWLGHVGVSDFLIMLLPTALVGVAMIGARRQAALTRELAQARETVAKLAASEERLRLARDMHDLTGQSLSMITLKSELAAKILARLPASPERDRAAEQVNEVARVSRQTLHDIREAVSGYRRPTLAVEVIAARTALEAAGIEPDDDPALTSVSGTFDADAEAALAWCLRESVTNVIRHSGARRCRMRLTRQGGELSLEVSDDGRGYVPGAPGAGLRGMSERLDAVGGRLVLGPAPPPSRGSHGFRLLATVPAAPVRAHARDGVHA